MVCTVGAAVVGCCASAVAAGAGVAAALTTTGVGGGVAVGAAGEAAGVPSWAVTVSDPYPKKSSKPSMIAKRAAKLDLRTGFSCSLDARG